MKRRRASQADFDAAHALVLECLVSDLNDYKEGRVLNPQTGEPARAPASLYGQLISLLKTNRVDRPDPDSQEEELHADEEFIELYEHKINTPSLASTITPAETAQYHAEVAKGVSQNPENGPSAPLTPSEARDALSPVQKTLSHWCVGCKEFHPRSDFTKHNGHKSGLQNECRAYRKKHRAKKKQPFNQQRVKK